MALTFISDVDDLIIVFGTKLSLSH